MYKYSKYLCDDKVDFLKNYKSNMNGKSSLLRGDNKNNLEIFLNFINNNSYYILNKHKNGIDSCWNYSSLDLLSIVDDYILEHVDDITGDILVLDDIRRDKLSFVKTYLVEFDAFCSLYDNGDINYSVFKEFVMDKINYLLFLRNIIKDEKLDYRDDYERYRIDLANNYLFSILDAMVLINNDTSKNFRKYIFTGNNDYYKMFDNIDINNIDYNKEFNKFISNNDLEGLFIFKNGIKRVLKR